MKSEKQKNQTKKMVLENKNLRNLIHRQKAILQQLQIQKEHLLYKLKETSTDDNLEKFEEESAQELRVDSMDDAQWNILISTLPVFGRPEDTIESFNKRRKLGEIDPEISCADETSKIHLQCTEHCVSSRSQCQGWKPFYEVRRGVNFGTRLITTLGGKTDTPQKPKDPPITEKCSETTKAQNLRRSKRFMDEGQIVKQVNQNSESKITEIKDDLNVPESTMQSIDTIITVKVEENKPEVKPVKKEYTKTDLSKRQETYFSNLIRTGVDRNYVEMEYLRLIGQPMSVMIYESLVQSEIKPVFIMDGVFRANEFYNFKFQLKAKILKEVKTKNIKVNDLLIIAGNLKAKAPFCTNPMISNLKLSTDWLHNLLSGMPVKRSKTHFCFSKK